MDKTDLRSHAWYYASIPRQRAEELVEKDGDFLVRDCVSQPGNYVLTCMAKGSILHFVINKVSVFIYFFLRRSLFLGMKHISITSCSTAIQSGLNWFFVTRNR